MRIGWPPPLFGAAWRGRLAAEHDVVQPLPRPDRRRGRGRRVGAPPAKVTAERLGIPVAQPARLDESVELVPGDSQVDIVARGVRTGASLAKPARPLGGGRYPVITRSFSLDHTTDDDAEIARVAIQLLSRAPKREKIRLAGVQVHNLERSDPAQIGLFDSPVAADSRNSRLNRALDDLAERFGEDAVTRGLAHADRAAPTHRIK